MLTEKFAYEVNQYKKWQYIVFGIRKWNENGTESNIKTLFDGSKTWYTDFSRIHLATPVFTRIKTY